MANEWSSMSLREAGVSLIDCEHRTPPTAEFGYPYVGIPQLKDGRINLNSARRIAREHFDEWRRKADPEMFDVVLSRRCNPGETGHVPKDSKFALGQNLVLLRSDGKRVVKPFLRWLVRGPQWWEQVRKYINVGAVFDSLKCADIPEFRLRVPPLTEQRTIAYILGTLDDKVELNRRMNETLEAMARALFKEWFVDFGPARTKAEGRDPGLLQSLADLFPARLVDSNLGEIPEGWPVETLADHFEAVKGVGYKGSGLGDGGVPLHNLNSIHEGGGYKYEGIKYYSGEHAERHVVLPGEVIVANTEQGHERLLIGYAAVVPSFYGNYCIASHHIYRVRPKPGSQLKASYICSLLNSPQMHDVVSGFANGTTVNMLPLDALQKPLIVCPPGALVEAYDALAANAGRRCEEMLSESDTLATLRDRLLPKLISGELPIEDGERLIEESV